MKCGLFLGKWVYITDNIAYKPPIANSFIISTEDWEVIKQLDQKYFIITITVLNTFKSKIIGYGR